MSHPPGRGTSACPKRPEQRAEQIGRGAHSVRQALRHLPAAYATRIHAHDAVLEFDRCAQFREHLDEHVHVVDVRQILDHAGLVDKSAAGIIATAVFFPPLTLTTPSSRCPPVMSIFSIVDMPSLP